MSRVGSSTLLFHSVMFLSTGSSHLICSSFPLLSVAGKTLDAIARFPLRRVRVRQLPGWA